MAELSALSNAYDHARQAAQEFVQSHREEAAQQHTAAARDFSRAARTTTDSEALRVLKLLEQQHRNLARIIHAQDDDLLGLTTTVGPVQGKTSSTPPKLAISTQSETPTGEKSLSHDRSARLNQNMRSSSPSLARDIASRRGIPSSGLASPSPARRQASSESQQSSPIPRIPASVVESQAQLPRSDQKLASDDDGFNAFYNSITTGAMSKLTSVLAYAGLPLNVEEAKEELPTKRSKRTVKASTEPDVKKIFSKAALNALEASHRSRGMQGHIFGPTESFYVVQTSGGSLSYADIANKGHRGQSEYPGGDDEEAFVDAQEAQSPSTRDSRTAKRGNFGNARTGEELELENATLKQTLEQLALRLANFETHAQDASMQALTQSVANLRPANVPDAASQERITLLEKRIEQQTEQKEKLEELARKQEKKIRAYHVKWEEIKKTAREKDKAKKEKQQLDEAQGIASAA